MAGLSTKLFLRVYGELPSGSSYFGFFVVCNEVNTYLVMKYFLETDASFMNFRKIAKALINNSFMNDKTYGSTENTRKR